jgi:signal transduction histidine kinase
VSPPSGRRSSQPSEPGPPAGRLAWITAARLLLYALLLASVAGFYLRGDAGIFPQSLRLVTINVGVAFLAAGLYAVWLRRGKRLTELAWTQVVVDQLIWTGLVYLSGGPLSGATSFYGLTCVLAAVTLGARGAVASAVIGGLLYLSLLTSLASGAIHLPRDQPPLAIEATQLLYPALVTVVGLLVVSLLAWYLARRLQTESGRVVEITERAERAERLAALGRVAAALAHEIRNPLGSIAGSIDIIAEAPGLGDDERRLCTIIRTEADRLNDLVSDMLNLARPRPPTLDLVDLARTASDVVRLARRVRKDGQDVPIEYVGPEALPIVADSAQLRQVVWNLVRNAVQATGAAQPVAVRVAATSGGGVRIEVIDHGAGIPADMRSRIFDAFVTTRSQGLGIGLAVVKQIVDAHEGTIEVRDSEGGGTTFVVTLPPRELEAAT